jgi:hypothetical protein
LLDVRHGPMVLIDDKTLVLACITEEGMEYQEALITDLVEKGATVVTYSEMPHEPIPGVRLQVDSGEKLGPAARGMHFIFLPQILAYYKAREKGVDPDRLQQMMLTVYPVGSWPTVQQNGRGSNSNPTRYTPMILVCWYCRNRGDHPYVMKCARMFLLMRDTHP